MLDRIKFDKKQMPPSASGNGTGNDNADWSFR
jgi:hypothetical protein